MKTLIFFLVLLYSRTIFATDYQVSIYLNEIREGYKPTYSSTVTIMNTAGRVVKTNKNIFTAPVISLITENKTCRTVSVKELNLPAFNGFVVTCSASAISTPDYLMLNGEPK